MVLGSLVRPPLPAGVRVGVIAAVALFPVTSVNNPSRLYAAKAALQDVINSAGPDILADVQAQQGRRGWRRIFRRRR